MAVHLTWNSIYFSFSTQIQVKQMVNEWRKNHQLLIAANQEWMIVVTGSVRAYPVWLLQIILHSRAFVNASQTSNWFHIFWPVFGMSFLLQSNKNVLPPRCTFLSADHQFLGSWSNGCSYRYINLCQVPDYFLVFDSNKVTWTPAGVCFL